MIAKCDAEGDLIRKVDPKIEKTIIPNAADTEFFKPGPPIPDEGPLNLLCVARLIKRKGQHHLIQAVKQLTEQGVEVTLDLVGDGDAEQEYIELVNSLQIEDKVNFLGYIPRSEMPEVYAHAHVFVLPSFNEGMSVATLEAMAAGLPVVVSKTPGTLELIDEGVNGFTFRWDDIENLVSFIRQLGENRSSARMMGVNSNSKASEFSLRSSADQLMNTTNQVYEDYSNRVVPIN